METKFKNKIWIYGSYVDRTEKQNALQSSKFINNHFLTYQKVFQIKYTHFLASPVLIIKAKRLFWISMRHGFPHDKHHAVQTSDIIGISKSKPGHFNNTCRDVLVYCMLPSYLIICVSADPSHLDDMSSEQVSGQSRRADNRSVMTGGIQTQGLGEGSEGKEYRTADSRAHGRRGGRPQITRLCNHRASNVQTYYEQLIGHTKLDEDDRQYTTSLHGNIHFANRLTKWSLKINMFECLVFRIKSKYLLSFPLLTCYHTWHFVNVVKKGAGNVVITVTDHLHQSQGWTFRLFPQCSATG